MSILASVRHVAELSPERCAADQAMIEGTVTDFRTRAAIAMTL
jgi:hypothetical protein